METINKISLTTPCEINKIFNTKKQEDLWIKLHKKKCNTCSNYNFKNLKTQSYNNKSQIANDYFNKHSKDGYSKFDDLVNFDNLLNLLNEEEMDKFYELSECLKNANNDKEREIIENIIYDFLMKKRDLYMKMYKM